MTVPAAGIDPGGYWDDRARSRGAIAADYRDPVLRSFEGPLRRRAFFAHVPWWRGIRVLDVGTGTGDWAIEFWKRGAVVTGVDISPEMVRMARDAATREGASIRFEAQRVQDLPAGLDGQFDVVTSITVLQHLMDDRDLSEALSKCAGALRSGGRLACMEHTGRGRRLRRTSYMRFRSRAEWLGHFGAAGFVPERIIAVRRVPLILLLYRAYSRIRWWTGPPATPTWDGRIWCALLRTVHETLTRVLPAKTPSDLTLFVLRRG